MYLLVGGIISGIFFFSLFGFTMHETKQNQLNFTEKDNNKQFKIKTGCIIQVKLKAAPGTGYAWRVVRNNPKILFPLKVEDPEIDKSASEEKKLGAEEFQKFRFKCLQSGINLLELHYDRRWEKEAKPEKKFTVNFIVDKNL
jgi:predicted secreted protein